MVEAIVRGSYWKGSLLLLLGLVIVIVNVLVRFGYLDIDLYFPFKYINIVGIILIFLGLLFRLMEKGKEKGLRTRLKGRV